MNTETTKLTIRLPRHDVEFAKAYAKRHNINVTELIDRYMRRLRELEQGPATSKLEAITGLVPAHVDARAEHRKHVLGKHG